MASSARKPSNVERARWRTKCREALCDYINATLHIHLEPSQIRLQPNQDDPYRWDVPPEKRYLFQKNLSDQSIGVYKILHDEVGITFTAMKSSASGQISFMKRINELQVQNDYLAQQVHLLKFQLDNEVQSRLDVSAELEASQARERELQEELEKAHRGENYFRNASTRYAQSLSKLLPVMSELQESYVVIENGFI